jgi:hypothetical protein
MKETYYFAHDYNAIQDPKMMSILSSCGISSIGLYWIIIELLHQQENNKISYQSYCDFIDFYGRINEENEHLLNKIKQMLISVGLFIKEDDFVYSNRVLKNIKQRKIISEKRSFAGKKSGEVRKNDNNIKQKITSVEHVLNKNEHNKENKIKENKIKEYNIDSSQQVDSPSQIADDFLNNEKSQYREKLLNKFSDNEEQAKFIKKEMLKFISYWTEPTKSGKKQRWQTEKTFEISRRLSTWFSRSNNFNKNNNSPRFIDLSNL